MRLIGLTGKAGAGKNSLADAIMLLDPKFEDMAFADSAKFAASATFNTDAFSHDKQKIVEPWGLSLREILQKFATESIRNVFGEDFWIKRWKIDLEINKFESVIVTDVRFENEAQVIRDMGGYIVHVYRKDLPNIGERAKHPSEKGIVYSTFTDIYVYNDGSIVDLNREAAWVLKVLGSQWK